MGSRTRGASSARATPTPRASDRATPVDLARVRNFDDNGIAARLDPAYSDGLLRFAGGERIYRGLPFRLAGRAARRRWLLLDRTVTIKLGAAPPTSHVVIAHFCDAWRDAKLGRPVDLPVGWVTPVGQPLARYTLETTTGASVERLVRRRFEINDGLPGWGQNAFAAIPHIVDEPLEWFGPYPAQMPARYAAPGEAGLLGTLPGTWGPAQTGVADSVPSPTNDLVLWLHAIAVPGGRAPLRRLQLEPLAAIEAGGGVVIAAITTFAGNASPLALAPRRSLRIVRHADPVTGLTPGRPGVTVDLGQVFRHRSGPPVLAPDRWPAGELPGWGSTRRLRQVDGESVVDLALARDAALAVDGRTVRATELPEEGQARRFDSVTIESLPTPTRRVEVEVVDASTGKPMPARVHVHAQDGRYLSPLGHRDEINPGLNEDAGADVLLGDTPYAYVAGRFPIEVPAGPVYIEAVRGFGYRPTRVTVDAATLRGPIVVPLEPVPGASGPGWTATDCHVHFISPTSALLQARAEGIAIVNLLATQWGDHHTSISDLPVPVVSDPSGEHHVVLGSENRQNMLGHIGLLGASQAVLPMGSGGAPEARLGDPLEWLMADWSDAARSQGGLALAVHFPLPYAEVAADIVAGKIEAVEMQALTPGSDGPSIREWYRFLRCGYRLPIVGGTDKMSAEVPLGAIRTYARLDARDSVSFEGWTRAVRAGRTFVSSGAFVDLEVDGCEPGDVIALGPAGGSVDVRAAARSALPIIERLELVHDGEVIAASDAGGSERVTLATRVLVRESGWLAARVTSRERIHSAFATAMGAHSSPVYLEVAGRRPWSPDDAAVIASIIEGARTWVADTATVREPAVRRRLVAYFDRSRATLRALGPGVDERPTRA